MDAANEFTFNTRRLLRQEEDVLQLLRNCYQFLIEVRSGTNEDCLTNQANIPRTISLTRYNIIHYQRVLAAIRRRRAQLYEDYQTAIRSNGQMLAGGRGDQGDGRSNALFAGGDHAFQGDQYNESIGVGERFVNQPVGRIGTRWNRLQCGDHNRFGNQQRNEPSMNYEPTENVLNAPSAGQNNGHAVEHNVLPLEVQSEVLNSNQSRSENPGPSNEQSHTQHNDQHQDVINEQDDDVSSETSDTQSRKSG